MTNRSRFFAHENKANSDDMDRELPGIVTCLLGAAVLLVSIAAAVLHGYGY